MQTLKVGKFFQIDYRIRQGYQIAPIKTQRSNSEIMKKVFKHFMVKRSCIVRRGRVADSEERGRKFCKSSQASAAAAADLPLPTGCRRAADGQATKLN